MTLLITIAIANHSHWPDEGSHKIYAAAMIPTDWLSDIHYRKDAYLERLEDVFKGGCFSCNWFGTLERAKKYAGLLQEEAGERLASEIVPILYIQGTHFRYAGSIYVDEAESIVDDDFYKVRLLLQNSTESIL